VVGDEGDNNSSLEEKISSEDEPAQRARSDDGDTTDSENDSIKNVDGSDDDDNDGSDDDSDDSNDQFSDGVFGWLISCSITI
jgi:hypothetical protein